jgi:DNA-directed RNA polymerase subunit M/transcription elongation factor TFIIS
MVKRQLRIREQGLSKFTVCERCNNRFDSKLLDQSEAEKEIREKFDAHHCKREEAKDKDSVK